MDNFEILLKNCFEVKLKFDTSTNKIIVYATFLYDEKEYCIPGQTIESLKGLLNEVLWQNCLMALHKFYKKHGISNWYKKIVNKLEKE